MCKAMSSAGMFRSNVLWLLAGNVGNAGSTWLMLIVMAQGSSESMVGIFGLGMAIAAPIFMLTNMELRLLLVTETKQETAFGHYFALRIVSIVFALIISCLVLAMYSYEREIIFCILLLFAAKSLEALADIGFALLQRLEKLHLVGKMMVARSSFSLACTVLVMACTQSAVLTFAALALVWAGVNLYLFFRLKEFVDIAPLFDKTTLVQLIKVGFPLGILMMLVSLNENIPRYLVEHRFDIAILGYFTGIMYLKYTATMVTSVIGQSLSRRLAVLYQSGDQLGYLGLMGKMMVFACLCGALGIAVAYWFHQPLVQQLYGSAFVPYSYLLVWFMIQAGIEHVTNFLGNGMAASRSFRIQPFVFAVVCLVNVAGCSYLIPSFGLMGIVYAMIAASCIQCVLGVLVNVIAIRRLSIRHSQIGESI